MPQSNCPDQKTLRQLASGTLPGAQVAGVEQHLKECEECAASVTAAMMADPFATALRQAQWSPQPIDPEDKATARRIAATVETQFNGSCETFISNPKLPLAPGQVWMDAPLEPGDLGSIGQFCIVRKIDEGGMGTVFEAIDRRLMRTVALKVMRPDRTGDHLGPERFLREARAAAAVHHPHVVTIFEVGKYADGTGTPVPFLAMELLRGETLQQRLQTGGRMSSAEAIEIARQVADGLSAAHRQGLLHRDIKPSNIGFENNNSDHPDHALVVKLLDFGLAKPVDASGDLTSSGLVVGSPGYLSPEQVNGATLDARSDLFSLGCVLYEMLTGLRAFDGATTLAKIQSLAVHSPPRVETVVTDVWPGLAELTHRLLARNPNDRPQSAADVARELATLASQELKRGSSESGSIPPTRRRTSWFWGWLAGAALMAVIVITIRNRDGSETKVTVDAPPSGEFTPKQDEAVIPPPKSIQTLTHLRAEDIPEIQRVAGQPVELVAVLGDQRLTEWDRPFEVEFHPSGEFLLPILERRVSQNVWSLGTLLPSAVFPQGEPKDGQAVFSPDGQFLFTAGKLYRVSGKIDQNIQVEPTSLVTLTGAPWGGFSPDSRWLITLEPSDGQFVFWDLSLPKPSGIHAGRWEEASGPQLELTIAKEPSRLIVNSPRGQLAETWVYDLDLSDTTQPKLSEPVRRPGRWVYARHAATAIELLETGVARVHDASANEPLLISELKSASGTTDVWSLRGDLTDDGKLAASIHGNVEVHLFRELDGGWKRAESLQVNANITAIQFSPNGQQLCVTSYDGFLNLWDVTQSPAKKLYSAPAASRVDRLTISPDGRFVGVAGWDGQIVYDLKTSPPARIEDIKEPGKGDGDWTFNVEPALALFPGREVWDLSQSPTAKVVSPKVPHLTRQFVEDAQELLSVVSDQQGTRFTWTPWTFTESRGFQLSSSTRSWSIPDRHVNPQRLIPTSQRVLSADPETGMIHIYDMGESGPARHEYSGYRNNSQREQISPSGQLAVTWPAGPDNGRLWDLTTQPPVEYNFPGGYRWLAFLPDEKSFLTADPTGGGVGLFDWRLNREIRKFQFPGIVDRVYMHPDGNHFLTVNRNGTVYVVRIGN